MEAFKQVLTGQFEAALAMLAACLERCPDAHWDTHIAKYPFWHVAYHALCFVDCYLAPSSDAWAPRTSPDAPGGALHPEGWRELDEEFPSRRFTRDELLTYVGLCRDRLHEALAAETEATLAGPSGFSRLPISRAELHLYNLRHVQHHVGQLTACLHRQGIAAKWVKSGMG